MTTCIGQGGIGKSRLFGLWLPVCQILGRQWCGLNTAGEPQKWLVLGDENSIARIKSDLQHLYEGLSQEERVKVNKFLRLQAVLGLEDADMNLGDATTQARLAQTIQEQAPGAVVADPLVNFAPGDISKPGEMKEALRLLVGTIRRAAPSAALLLLHHARTGRQNIAQGVGYDAANFASGGKTLFAAARCQMNLMPASEEDDTRLLLSCAKANNCQKFAAAGWSSIRAPTPTSSIPISTWTNGRPSWKATRAAATPFARWPTSCPPFGKGIQQPRHWSSTWRKPTPRPGAPPSG